MNRNEQLMYQSVTDLAKAIEKLVKLLEMRRLIYDMYYADEISVEIAERLLDRLEKSQEKRRKNGRY